MVLSVLKVKLTDMHDDFIPYHFMPALNLDSEIKQDECESN